MIHIPPDAPLSPDERASYLEDHVRDLIADKERQCERIWKLERSIKSLQSENAALSERVDTLEQDNRSLTGRMDTLERNVEEARDMMGAVSSMGQALQDIVRDALKCDDLASLRQLERRLLKLRSPECSAMIEEIEKREVELMQAQGTPRTGETTNVFHPGASQFNQSTLQSPSFGMAAAQEKREQLADGDGLPRNKNKNADDTDKTDGRGLLE